MAIDIHRTESSSSATVLMILRCLDAMVVSICRASFIQRQLGDQSIDFFKALDGESLCPLHTRLFQHDGRYHSVQSS